MQTQFHTTTITTRAEALLEGITKGEWYAIHGDDRMCMNTHYVATVQDGDDPCEISDQVVCVTLYQADRCASHKADCWEEDAAFIAAAPSLVRELVEEVKRLEAALAKAYPIDSGHPDFDRRVMEEA